MTILRRQLGIYRFVASPHLSSVGQREFAGIAATDDLCIDGIALDMGGGDVSRLQNGQLSWNHKIPIGRIPEAHTTAHELLFTGRFAAAGVDDFVDELCSKLKADVITGVSLSFNVLASTPITGGQRATKWEALEISLCLTGVDPNAGITARARDERPLIELSPLEQQADERRRTMQAWALGRGREEQYSFAQRQQDLRDLLETKSH